MKLILLMIISLLLITNMHSYTNTKRSNTILGALNSRFLQANNFNKFENENKEHAFQYNVKITILSEIEKITDIPYSFQSNCEFSDKSINLYQNGDLTNQISYLE